MNEFLVAVCDDEESCLENTLQYFKAYESEREVTFAVEKFYSGFDLLKAMRERGKRYDLILLDVDMPVMNGVDTAMEIRKDDADVVICYITSYENYAYHAFEVNAIGYLLKPVAYVKLRAMFDRCVREIRYLKDRQAAEKIYLDVSEGRNRTIVPFQHILYFEKQRNLCVIHTTEGEMSCYRTLANIYEKLDPDRFFYCHRAFIVNFDYINEVLPNCVCLGDGLEIPLSRRYYKNLRKRHMDKIYRLQSERRKQRNRDMRS